MESCDGIIVVSFGGPEGMDEVVPFLENVLRGRKVPPGRIEEVAAHYEKFGGISPINAQNRALVAALESELQLNGLDLRVYWGNRNWHPFLADEVRRMAKDGIRRALAFVTSAYSSYSSCRQYREDIRRACEEVGAEAPQIEKLRVFFNHPGFIRPNIENARRALESIPEAKHRRARLVFTAHSIPDSIARNCRYEAQLNEAARLIAEGLGRTQWDLVYQSRSGPPQQPWLEPDILDHLVELKKQSVEDVVLCPVGFISDHMEVLYDLDTEARHRADELGIHLVRAATVGVHPDFVSMIRMLIQERLEGSERLVLGILGPAGDVCTAACCPPASS